MRIYNLDNHKYRIYQHNNTIIAVSTYGGEFVKGRATCSTNDTFDIESGMKLAALRCNEKIAKKRAKNAELRMIHTDELVERVHRLHNRYIMESEESARAAENAAKALNDFIETL